mmetsp:Transcript_50430/g.128245  ORF Transcript_50430/g.128245 Transcript_50430/m.128245 type:complete len:230 (-) Transcript_50430:373-1062(-)
MRPPPSAWPMSRAELCTRTTNAASYWAKDVLNMIKSKAGTTKWKNQESTSNLLARTPTICTWRCCAGADNDAHAAAAGAVPADRYLALAFCPRSVISTASAWGSRAHSIDPQTRNQIARARSNSELAEPLERLCVTHALDHRAHEDLDRATAFLGSNRHMFAAGPVARQLDSAPQLVLGGRDRNVDLVPNNGDRNILDARIVEEHVQLFPHLLETRAVGSIHNEDDAVD